MIFEKALAILNSHSLTVPFKIADFIFHLITQDIHINKESIMTAPKLFISYSWSNAQHEELVMQIATELVESGVDVILDKWDLRESHDAYEFMESMVTDPEINKVAIFSDKVYAEKADGRSGGVGTETQIISQKIYDGEDKDKFVAIVTERNENGKPYLPTYYKTKIFIDMSNNSTYVENFDKLVRWIFNKPLHVKPEIGKRPSFLDESNISLGATAAFKRALDAIKNAKPSSDGFLNEYLTLFSDNLERFRIESDPKDGYENIVKNISEFIPSRNEYIQIINAISQFNPNPSLIKRVNRFLESTLKYIYPPEEMRSFNETSFDNFMYITNELFLYTLAILIKDENFSLANLLLSEVFILPKNARPGRNATSSYVIFRQYLKSMAIRNDVLKSNRVSIHADLLKQHNAGTGLDFQYIMQADFISFLRYEITSNPDDYAHWWPTTLAYFSGYGTAFEVFLRSISTSYFEKSKIILGINSKYELEELMSAYQSGERQTPHFNYTRISPSHLINYDLLATKP